MGMESHYKNKSRFYKRRGSSKSEIRGIPRWKLLRKQGERRSQCTCYGLRGC